ncbi:unnamed protein product, partial [Rotaria sordida]
IYRFKSYHHSTMDMNEYVPKSSEQPSVQDGLLKKKKKKCHGNRKLQHFRRKCRAKGMTDQAIEMLILLKKENISMHQNTQQTYEEQMDGYFIVNTVRWLTDFTMLQFLQQRAELMCTVLQLKIEQDYWNNIANLITIPVVVWLSEAGKDITKQNSINWDHTKTKINIQHRQKIIENKLQQAEYNLNIRLQQQSCPFDCEIYNKTSMDHFLNIISNVLVTLVENSLYYLHTNFEQKKILLNFDITDANLVKSFYDLNPTVEQIVIVRKIWRDQLELCKKVIRQKKKNRSSSIYQQIAWKNGAALEQDPLLLNDNDSITEVDNLLANETQEEVPTKFQVKSLEEQDLSQRLSQLSMTSHYITEHLNMVNVDTSENIPLYLSKENKSFEQIISDLSSNELAEELRQMAIVIHQIFLIDLEKLLWTTYLKSGTGQLQLNHMDNDNLNRPHLWPIQVQKLVSKQSPDNIDTAACLTYVTQYLDELDDKMKRYQTTYNMKKNQYVNYLPTIQAFVHQQLQSTRLAIEQKIAIVHYNYNDYVLELKFLAYNPTQQQKKMVEKLNHAKYQEEITKEEYNLLKYRISIEESSSTSLELPNEKLLKTIEDQSIQQKLRDQYINTALQARKDMIQL